MNINWICLCVVILAFLYRITAEDCFAKREKGGSEDATESPVYYIQESSIAKDPMMALYSDQQLIKEESPLATLFKQSLMKRPSITDNLARTSSGQIQSLHQILNLKALPEIPRTGLRKSLGNPLIKEFSKQPNIIARKIEDLRPSSSDLFAYKARECLANPFKDRILQTPRLADKLKELSEKAKKVFDEKIASTKTKISKLKSYSARDSKPINTDEEDEEEVGYTFTVEHVTKPTPWVVYASLKPLPTEKSEEITEAPSLAERVKAAKEKNRKAFADAIASSKEKMRKINAIIRGDPEPVIKDVVYASLEGTLPIEDEK